LIQKASLKRKVFLKKSHAGDIDAKFIAITHIFSF